MPLSGLASILAALLARQPNSPLVVSGPLAQQAATSAAAAATLDYDVFRTRVQPIVMSPRKGNARCTACGPKQGNVPGNGGSRGRPAAAVDRFGGWVG